MHLSLALSFSLCLKKVSLADGCVQSQLSEIRVLESFMETYCHSLTLWNARTAPSALAARRDEGTKGIVFIWVWESAVKPPRQSLCDCVCFGGQRQFQLVLSWLAVDMHRPWQRAGAKNGRESLLYTAHETWKALSSLGIGNGGG